VRRPIEDLQGTHLSETLRPMAVDLAGEAKDPNGARIVVPAALWRDKIIRDHPELASYLADVLRAVTEPDLVLVDPVYENRRRHYLRGAGPSRWLLVVVSYEQEPARIISAFGNRKDPRSWSK
jgi:hypothetical protein